MMPDSHMPESHETESERRIWFPAKTYGWGWGVPCAWQGWVVLLGYLIVLVVLGFLLLPWSPLQFVFGTAVATVLLVVICYLKGEKPRASRADC